MIHTKLPLNCVVFLLLCELTRSGIYGSQKVDSHKWPTLIVDKCTGFFYMRFITHVTKRLNVPSEGQSNGEVSCLRAQVSRLGHLGG